MAAVGVLEVLGRHHGLLTGHALVEACTKRHLTIGSWRLLSRLHWWHAEAWHTALWGLLRRRISTLLNSFVALHVTGHLEVTNLLLQLDELVIQASVELVGLNEHVGELVLGHNSIIQRIEELSLGRVKRLLLEQVVEGLTVLRNNLGNLGPLLLELIDLLEVFNILSLETFEDSGFVSVVLGNLHELLNSVVVLVHGNTFGHASILLHADVIALVKGILDCYDNWILTSVGSALRLRD